MARLTGAEAIVGQHCGYPVTDHMVDTLVACLARPKPTNGGHKVQAIM